MVVQTIEVPSPLPGMMFEVFYQGENGARWDKFNIIKFWEDSEKFIFQINKWIDVKITLPKSVYGRAWRYCSVSNTIN